MLTREVQLYMTMEYSQDSRLEKIEIYWRNRKIVGNILYQSKGKLSEDEFLKDCERWISYIEPLTQQKGRRGLGQYFMKHCQIVQFDWNSCVGLKDAAVTARTVGVLWGLKAILIQLLEQKNMTIDKKQIAINPAYNKFFFSTSLLAVGNMRFDKVVSFYLRMRNNMN